MGRENLGALPPPLEALYVLRSLDVLYAWGDRRDLLHVMSTPAKGQIRGYYRWAGSDGPWLIQPPNYTGDWPAVDAAVELLTGERVRAD